MFYYDNSNVNSVPVYHYGNNNSMSRNANDSMVYINPQSVPIYMANHNNIINSTNTNKKDN